MINACAAFDGPGMNSKSCRSQRIHNVNAPMSRKPSISNRVSNFVFGSPSAVRANGGRHSSVAVQLLPGRICSKRLRRIPVFYVDEGVRSRRFRLPRVWITEPVFDLATAESLGREYVASYPCDNDEGGVKAFQFGLNYFSEALGTEASGNSFERAECFRAAEILFLHAIERGCLDAAVKLGMIYEADLCEGTYFGREFSSVEERALFLNAKAMEYFSLAAQADDSEALRRMGNMIAVGRGCAEDPSLAFSMLLRSFDLADRQGDLANRGYAALAIAAAYENGVGCAHSFRSAYCWYRLAEEDLAYVVEEGGWHYKKPKHRAALGVRRMKQELIGGC